VEGVRIVRWEDLPWRLHRPQRHADGRFVAVHSQLIDSAPDRRVLHTKYDPGLVLERHGHEGDEIIFVIEGDLMVGDEHVAAPATIILERNNPFGPLVAGSLGTTILEVFIDGYRTARSDPDSIRNLLVEQGIELLPEA
jgi:hypothetical protein